MENNRQLTFFYASNTPMRHPFSCRVSKYGLDPASLVAMISICGYSSVRSIHSEGIASTPIVE